MALALASTALDASNAVLGQIGEAPAAAPEQSHSWLNHWPASVAGLSCLIVTISAVALGILGSAAASISLGVAAIGCGVSTIYLRSYPTFKNLDSYARVLAQQLTRIATIVRQFAGENKKLAEIEKNFAAAATIRSDLFKKQKEAAASVVTGLKSEKQMLEAAVGEREKTLADEKAAAKGALETLTQTKTDLEQTVKERELQIQAEKEASAKALSGLNTVSAQLQQAQTEKTEIEQILSGSHEKLSDMTSKIDHLSSVNTGINASSDKLAQELSSIRTIRTEFQASITALQQEDGALAEKKKAADDLVVKVYGLVENVMQMLVEVKKKKEELDAGVVQMHALNEQLASQASSSKKETDKMHDNIDKLEKLSRLVDLLPLDSPKPPGLTATAGRLPDGGAAAHPPAAAPTGGEAADRSRKPQKKEPKKKEGPSSVQPATSAAQPVNRP